ncbi:peptidoglycan DD-metalloendopeptidase family protein [Amorphus sp. 3PC139-8]|uniref:peptidoglycan DD-metalloendopeptidase family protein n=1 Tax=Amorphus sp. 3PC139-8 TaxID=2735676 RepID=UPI00345DAE70
METAGRAAAAILIAAIAAGCSADVSRFAGGPIYAGSTPNQRQLLTGDGTGDDQIVTGSLPGTPSPTASVQRSSVMATGQSAGPAVTYKGWSSAGGTPIYVQYGDTPESIARRYGVPVEALVATNNLSPGTALQPGHQLVIPTYSSGAPTTQQASLTPSANTAASKPVPARSASGTYTVKPGDTAWSIATSHNVKPSELMAANDLPPNGTIKIGQTLKIPGASGAGTTTVAGTPSGAQPTTLNQQKAELDANSSTTSASSKPQPTKDVQVASLPSEAGKAGAAVSQSDASDPAPSASKTPPTSGGADGFRWPVRGRIVEGFGKQSDGSNNDGINLAVPEGTPVKASESGTVIYAGNELQGYGNLILIQHKDGWVSAYAHNSELMVKRGESVQRGQVIAKAGATGSVSQPQLHFELRKGSQPVDPLPHLAGA